MNPARQVTDQPIVQNIFAYSEPITFASTGIPPYFSMIKHMRHNRKIRSLIGRHIPEKIRKSHILGLVLLGTVSQATYAVISYTFNENIVWAIIPAAVRMPVAAYNLHHAYTQVFRKDNPLTRALYSRKDRDLQTLLRARENFEKLLEALFLDIMNEDDTKILDAFDQLTSDAHLDQVGFETFFSEVLLMATRARIKHLDQEPDWYDLGEESAKFGGSILGAAKSVFDFWVVMQGGLQVINSYGATVPTAIASTVPQIWPNLRYGRKATSRMFRFMTTGKSRPSRSQFRRYPIALKAISSVGKLLTTAMGLFGTGYMITTCNEFTPYNTGWGLVSAPATGAVAMTTTYLTNKVSNALWDGIYRISANEDMVHRNLVTRRLEWVISLFNSLPNDIFRKLFSTRILIRLAADRYEDLEDQLRKEVDRGHDPKMGPLWTEESPSTEIPDLNRRDPDDLNVVGGAADLESIEVQIPGSTSGGPTIVNHEEGGKKKKNKGKEQDGGYSQLD